MLCALIMAGGKGERFWPMSTEEKPKQFLNLLGEESMIQCTVRRLEEIIPLERIFIVTAEKYTSLIYEHIPNLPKKNVIVEPEVKNTAPCIAYSAFYIREYYEDATLVVLPSDHLILEEDEFRSILLKGEEFIDNKNDESILTIGIKPTRPDTGYGYIYANRKNMDIDKYEVFSVESFKEKPCLELAEKYIKDSSYLWNSGMFVWKAKTIISLTRKYLPNIFENINNMNFKDYNNIKENYGKLESVSVDYGIMEKANNIYVIPGNFGWDDLGSWNSLSRYKDTDSNNNVIDGSIAVLNSKNNIIQTMKKTYVMGVEDLIVIETDNEIMIVNKKDISKIKELKNYGE